MGKKSDAIMAELRKEIEALIDNYDVDLITAVLTKEIARKELELGECIHTHMTHVGGRKEA
jgi:hypothetical protein